MMEGEKLSKKQVEMEGAVKRLRGALKESEGERERLSARLATVQVCVRLYFASVRRLSARPATMQVCVCQYLAPVRRLSLRLVFCSGHVSALRG